MTNDEERDYAEEQFNAELCPLCEYSPCDGGDGIGSCVGDGDPIDAINALMGY